MAEKYLLPALKNTPEIESDQLWELFADPYDFLLNNLKLYYEPNVSIFDGGSNATPHIYEQMLIFHKAFFQGDHPEHQRAVLEWRVILFVMALQRICNLRVSVEKVELSENSPNAFLRAAAMMKPQDKPVFHHTTWDFFYLLLLDDEPIAIFSPLTLVCPVKQLMKKIEGIVPLSIQKENGTEQLLFEDRVNKRAFENLGAWLGHLADKLACSDEKGICVERFGQVIKELKDFERYCRGNGDASEEQIFKYEIYSSMNSSIRKDYDFFNYCCDIYLANPKWEFLIHRYQDDIFIDQLPLVVWNDTPGTMENKDYIRRLDEYFHSILKPGNGSARAIEVRRQGGERMAACALMPFKEGFVEELISHEISSQDFFEQFTVTCDADTGVMEVRLQIKGFPYYFSKKYSKQQRHLILAEEMVTTCLWPPAPVDALNWNLYYAYSAGDFSKTEVAIPGASGEIQYDGKKGIAPFRLIRTNTFPAYIKYSNGRTGGYLPVTAEPKGQKQDGGKLTLFVDIGHSSTSVLLVKDGKERIPFLLPQSVRIAGKKDLSVQTQFIVSDAKAENRAWFKNMIHSFRDYNRSSGKGNHITPFEDGVVLFDYDSYQKLSSEDGIGFVNFEYAPMDPTEREKAHLMVEQILLYTVYQAALKNCSYLEVCFLHGYRNDCTQLGELKGLWANAFNWVREWTGIRKSIPCPIQEMWECEALAYATYHEFIEERKVKGQKIPEDSLYIGVDIGWKKTQAAFLTNIDAKQKQDETSGGGEPPADIMVHTAEIEYAGRDISLLNADCTFPQYPELLNILLKGSRDLRQGEFEELLREFGSYYGGAGSGGKDKAYYDGLFDVIAAKIEAENFKVPPDVYNNMPEFRLFINLYTYNILLLFLNIGYLLKRVIGNQKQVKLYLSGNGAKFIRWISNDKDYTKIDKGNAHEAWIPQLKHSVLDWIMKGCLKENAGTEGLEIEINLTKHAKEQLLEGFAFRHVPGLYSYSPTKLELHFEELKNEFDVNGGTAFKGLCDELYAELIGGEIMEEQKSGSKVSDAVPDISEMLRMNSKTAAKKVIDKMNK